MRVDHAIWDAVEAILAHRVQMAVAVTGGGSSLLNWLFNHPGASRALLEAQIPYCAPALENYLAFPGPHRVEAQTARQMADTAYARARLLSAADAACWGVGLTAALATDRTRRGADRAHFAVRTGASQKVFQLAFAKGQADRLEQEEMLSRFVLDEIARQCGRSSSLTLPTWIEPSSESWELHDPIDLLLRGLVEVVEVAVDGRVSVDVERRQRLLYPGSFNPLHEGHCQLAVAASHLSGREAALEISLHNVDKPPLERGELQRRLQRIRGRFAVCLTREPTFYGKSRHFCAPHFAIGYDTAVRLLDGKYYPDGKDGMLNSLGEMLARGCRFWVAGRQVEGIYRTLDDVVVPSALCGLFIAIKEDQFRLDISSTEMRAREKGV